MPSELSSSFIIHHLVKPGIAAIKDSILPQMQASINQEVPFRRLYIDSSKHQSFLHFNHSSFLPFLPPPRPLIALRPLFLDIAQCLFHFVNCIRIARIFADVVADFDGWLAVCGGEFDYDIQRDRFLGGGLMGEVVCEIVSLYIGKEGEQWMVTYWSRKCRCQK